MNAPATILLVDDIAANRETLRELLESQAYRLMEAADGPTALELAAETPPDLVLLDVMMSGMDGFEVCRRLRADTYLTEVPVVMVTALDDQDSRIAGIEAGADDFVTKPINRAELRARVRTITRLNRYRRIQQGDERIREQAALIDLSPDAIIVCNLSQRITHWNPAAERLYGWRAEEAIGQRANELLLNRESPDAPGTEPYSNDEWRREVTHITRERKDIIVTSHRKLLRNAEGQPKAIMMINTDLTEKKQLEEQFLRAQRLECVGTLAAGIAHDLNNVLSPIMMSVALMRMANGSEADQDILDTLETSAQRGADLIRQILGFASGTGSERSEVQLRHLLNAVVTMLRGAFPAGIKIKTEVPGKLWPVVGNATQLDQVLMNLCVNARDAMPEGGELRISLENVTLTETDCSNLPATQPGTYVCVTVADTGMGMPPEVVARIFDAFFTTKAEGKGTGLGLATVQTVVQGHGGFLTVESEVGRGTRFQVCFPAIPNVMDEPSHNAEAADLPRGNGEWVLVVEDKDGILETMAATLERFGYRTLKAVDGLEALERFVEHRVSIQMVITDMEMPQLGGPALAQIVRGLDPDLPILLMSGAQEDEQLKANGWITEFLKKPFDTAELLQTIQRILPPATP